MRRDAVLRRKRILREEGEVLFKDYGLSGIAIFQLSRALARQKKDVKRRWSWIFCRE